MAKREPKAAAVVRVHNPHRDGFRRGGKAHAKGTVDHPATDFTPEQLEALQADPGLTVTVVENPADAPPPQDNPAQK